MAQVGNDLVGDWEIDPAHTRIGFSARHAMVTKVRGAFNDVEGRLHVAPGGPAESSVTVRLAAASIDTRHAQRDAHLRSADFFDVERFPDITFRSRMVEEVELWMYMVVGDLTIRGITHEIAVPIELRGVERGADGELRAGFEGNRRVDRRAWGLEWQVPLDAGGVLVSERVTMEFDISAVKVSTRPGGTPGAGDRAVGGGDGAAGVSAPPTTFAADIAAPPAQLRRDRGRLRETGGWFERMRDRRR